MAAQNPIYLQNKGYTAREMRQANDMIIDGEGALGPTDLRVSASGMGVSVAAGEGAVRGDSNSNQGIYMVRNDAAVSLSLTSDPTNPKPYIITFKVNDQVETGGGADSGVISARAGTPAAGITLDNRTNFPALGVSELLLADVVVPAAAVSISASNIRDRRPIAIDGVIPPIKTVVDMVRLLDAGGNVPQSQSYNNGWNNRQSAVPVYLPRRIVGANRLRWAYQHISAVAATGNYMFAIMDASGRLIVSTASTALAGAASSFQAVSLTIATTTFEAGLYWLLFGTAGLASTFASSSFVCEASPSPDMSGAGFPNSALFSASGGVTAPTTLNGFTDQVVTGATPSFGAFVPQAALSVG